MSKNKKTPAKLLKMRLINRIERIPFIGTRLLFTVRTLKFWLYYKPRFLLTKFSDPEEDPFQIYWVNPKDIVRVSGIRKNIKKKISIGTVEGGDWDRSTVLFKDLKTYSSLKEHFVHGVEWEKTEYYQDALKRIDGNEMPWMCSSEADLQERVENLDQLFASIKEDGFTESPDKMIDVYSYKDDLSKQSLKNHAFLDYILIDMDRNGEPMFVDGGHRLMMAKILGIHEVPVIVRIRHKEWDSFRQELKEYAKASGGYLYQKAPHFDLAIITYGHDESRIDLIKKTTSLQSGSVLDIGSYLGLHCSELEDAGFKCTAIETNPVRTYFTEKIRDANKQSFEVINASILTFRAGEVLAYDIVLALNIFHHFLKDKKTHNDLKDLLGRMECEEMFFETHNAKEDQMKASYVNYPPEEFANFILENSSLNHCTLLEELDTGRRLYKLYK